MEVRCSNCKAKLNIPEDKIPKGKSVSISCPRCKSKIPVKSTDAAEAKKREKGLLPDDASSEAAAQPEGDLPLDYYKEGVKLCLLAFNEKELVNKLKHAAEGLGYKCVVAANTANALSRLRQHRFDLVLLSDRFDGIDLDQSPVLEFLNNLPMSVRRRIFFGLLGKDFRTMDRMTAFAWSANMVFSENDVDEMPSVLDHAISDHERFYRVFFEVLRQLGKA